MDPFDHVLTSLINQAEEDVKFGIPFKDGPVKLRSIPKKISVEIAGTEMFKPKVGLIGIGKWGKILRDKLRKKFEFNI